MSGTSHLQIGCNAVSSEEVAPKDVLRSSPESKGLSEASGMFLLQPRAACMRHHATMAWMCMIQACGTNRLGSSKYILLLKGNLFFAQPVSARLQQTIAFCSCHWPRSTRLAPLFLFSSQLSPHHCWNPISHHLCSSSSSSSSSRNQFNEL